MWTKEYLIKVFKDVRDLGEGVYSCQIETPMAVNFFYFKLSVGYSGEMNLLMISENGDDPEFAKFVLNEIRLVKSNSKILILPLNPNSYNFKNILIAANNYHSCLEGVLDSERENLYLCLPIHRCEFSGTETVREFYQLRRVIPSFDWHRKVSPKIFLRFNNPKTKGGTYGSGVFVDYTLILAEIDNLNGAIGGFIEIKNYKNEMMKILPSDDNMYKIFFGKNEFDAMTILKSVLIEKVWDFLIDSK